MVPVRKHQISITKETTLGAHPSPAPADPMLEPDQRIWGRCGPGPGKHLPPDDWPLQGMRGWGIGSRVRLPAAGLDHIVEGIAIGACERPGNHHAVFLQGDCGCIVRAPLGIVTGRAT